MLETKRILIADDHRAIRNGIRLILNSEFEGLEYGEATDGPEALNLLKAGNWDLLILDLDLPGKTGYEVLQIIRSENINVPVLIFSFHNISSLQLPLISLGASKCLSKDVSDEEFVSTVAKLINL